MEQCTETFAEVFSAHSGGIVRTCACGTTTFNYMDKSFFDPGELEELEEKSKRWPDRYRAVDYTVTTMNIGGIEIVHGCTCNIARKHENFILENASKIAQYLNLYAAELKKKAELIKVNGIDSEHLKRGGT